eukprot:TRINITY_DN23361_c0_g1_i1.p1 TRINITY_DN23361_c0_g1~~TRINITY_DN23361_c0_g1_i1.p1  ORF type:complete len:358 (+),score=78.77 TRINITY_DN23361_c0_g1_i1:48-1121(+)
MATKKQNPPLPQHIEEQRTRAFVNKDIPTYTDTNFHHAVYQSLGFDNSFDINEFKSNFQIKIQSMNDEEMIFDLIGVDAPIANALRRVLISEVPTLAIENVYIIENSSIIQDEVLAHRLGLIPIKADPRWFEYLPADGELTDKNTLEFTLKVKCEKKKDYKESYPDHLKYEHSKVYSGDMVWVPHGVQADEFVGENAIKPVHDDILIAKLRPGQEIDLSARCCKGIGKDHAKFSPVATATYRLLPEVTIIGDLTGDKADALVKKCPMNVFDIEDLGGKKKAKVVNPRNCSMCRECIREVGWDKLVKLRRKKDHFIFHIESTQILPPKILFEEAVKKLLEKIETLRVELQKLATPGDE